MTSPLPICPHLSYMRDHNRPMDYDPRYVCVREHIIGPCIHCHAPWCEMNPPVWCPFLEAFEQEVRR